MAAQNPSPSPSASSAPVLVIVEGLDDKRILEKIFQRKNITQIKVISAKGIGNIPQTISQEYRNYDRILVIVDSDQDPPEVRAKDLYHKIWEALNREGFSEKLSENFLYTGLWTKISLPR